MTFLGERWKKGRSFLDFFHEAFDRLMDICADDVQHDTQRERVENHERGKNVSLIATQLFIDDCLRIKNLKEILSVKR